jgi:NADP-dependent 3-hydroxy acid dehydrogenase YdfG
VKQLLAQSQPWRFILGCRDTKAAQAEFDKLSFDRSKHSVTVLPLELSDLKTVKTFTQQTIENLGSTKLDTLMLNAALIKSADAPGPNGSKWCESYIVNHLCMHWSIRIPNFLSSC